MENAVLKSKLGNKHKLKVKPASTNEAVADPLNVKKKKT